VNKIERTHGGVLMRQRGRCSDNVHYLVHIQSSATTRSWLLSQRWGEIDSVC